MAKSPIQSMHQTLDSLQSSTQHIGHIANDRENLVSPEKVYSTQNTLEKRMKESQYRNDGHYGSLEKKYNASDYQYPNVPDHRIRFPDSSPAYTITDKTFATDNSPGQYSSIERKINQESFDLTDKQLSHDSYDSAKSPLRKTMQEQREQSYGKYSHDSQNYSSHDYESTSVKKSADSPTYGTTAPPPPPPQMPRSPIRKNFADQQNISNKQYSHEQKNFEEKTSSSFEKRTESLDPKYFPTMSTFRSEKIGSGIEPARNYIATAGIPQSQTFTNVDSKLTPGGRVETITTKVYTSTPGKSISSSNFETLEKKEFSSSGNDMSTFKALDNSRDSVEQRTIKQSMTQKVTEKKTVTMTMSSRQESNTKSFRFEDK